MPALEGPLVGLVAISVQAFPSGRVPTDEVCKIMEPDEIYKNTGVGGDNDSTDGRWRLSSWNAGRSIYKNGPNEEVL